MFKLLVISTYSLSGGVGIAQSVIEFNTAQERQAAFEVIKEYPKGRYLSVEAFKL